MRHIESILHTLGFNKKEARVYLASLRLGQAPASEIAREVTLNRVTTYEVLKRLVHRGLASVTEQKHVKYFSVLGPDKLFQHFKTNMDALQQHMKELLSLTQGKGARPRVSFYEGAEGLRDVYRDFHAYRNSEALSFTNCRALYEGIGKNFLYQTYKNRQALGITVRSLCPDNPEDIAEQRQDARASRRIKLFPHEKYRIPNEMIVYADKVALMSFTDKISIVIENKEIAESLRTIWHMVWDRY
ncbi:MAG: helix-turn-helix domain-containing protein [Patescibacteria group bacterium]